MAARSSQSPGRTHHGDVLPVPPPGRGAPSHPSSSSRSAPFSPDTRHVPSPMKRFHHPSRWSEWSADNSKTTGTRTLANEEEGGTAKLLEALGLSPIPSCVAAEMPGAVLPARPYLPDYAPDNLEHCANDCYWMFLVHTLLGEVDEIKQGLADTEKKFQIRAAKRRELEDVTGYRDRILDELQSMNEELTKLRVDVPRVRQDHAKLQDQSDGLEQRCCGLVAKQQDLKTAIQNCAKWQEVAGRKLQYVEQDCEEEKAGEHELADQIQAAKDDMELKDEELQRLTSERDEMRIEVTALEDAKASRKKAAQKKK